MVKFEFDDSAMDDFLSELEHIEIDCPECNHPFNISVNDMGKTVTCPHCHTEIKLELK